MDKDANDQIKKALDLLDSKNVASNLEEILNRYVFEAPDIDYQCEQGLSDDLLQELEIKEINHQLNFSYKSKLLQILLTNKIKGTFPDGDTYEHLDLIVLYNGICVLKDRVSTEHDDYGPEYKIRRFFETTLKRFKNGSWLDDLNYLLKSVKDYEQQKIQIKNETIKKTLANNIDLDPID